MTKYKSQKVGSWIVETGELSSTVQSLPNVTAMHSCWGKWRLHDSQFKACRCALWSAQMRADDVIFSRESSYLQHFIIFSSQYLPSQVHPINIVQVFDRTYIKEKIWLVKLILWCFILLFASLEHMFFSLEWNIFVTVWCLYMTTDRSISKPS